MAWLSHIPILIALPLFALVFAGIAVGAHLLVRVLVPPERLIDQHEVAGFIVAVVGVLYSVVLGFLVGTVWTGFSTAQDTTDQEAAYVGDAYGFTSLLLQPYRNDLQRTLARYAFLVRDKELSAQNATTDTAAVNLIYHAVEETSSMPPPPARVGEGRVLENNTIRTELLGALRSLADERRLRGVQSRSRLPAGMLEALILGAAMVIVFAFFFGVKPVFYQMVITGLLAGSIGLFFGLILELSTPYSGAIRVSPDAWDAVIANNHFAQVAR